ncbi:MAG: PD40 domain-containing protein, partial [Planctomycetaceae bacterium]|nr:PD40 domain-containing protein [Planctomycetaceae bacterium]
IRGKTFMRNPRLSKPAVHSWTLPILRWQVLALVVGLSFVFGGSHRLLAQEPELMVGELPVSLGRTIVGSQRLPTIQEVIASTRKTTVEPLALVEFYADDSSHHAPKWSGDGKSLVCLRADLTRRSCKVLLFQSLNQATPDILYGDSASYDHMALWNHGGGKNVVFSSNNQPDKNENIHLLSLSPTSEDLLPRRLTDTTGVNTLPSLQIQGTEGTLTYRHDEELRLFKFNARQTDKPTQDLPLGEGKEVTVSPDGKQLAFVQSNPQSPLGEMVVLKDEATRLKPVTVFSEPECLVRNPTWSPDGKKIAVFVRPRTQVNWQLWTVSTTGNPSPVQVANAVRVQEDFPHVTPAWSPDGQSLWYLNDRGSQGYYPLQSVTLDGKQSHVDYDNSITTAMDLTVCPDPNRAAIAFTGVKQYAQNVYILVLNHY